MRLLHTTMLEMREFISTGLDETIFVIDEGSYEEINNSGIPNYAILSHTWGEEEVTFQDMTGDRHKAESKLGFSKIINSCRQAARDGFEYIWIDTCCIDKSSSAELSEAINSMYRWYEKSKLCYAYMSDVSCIPETPEVFHSSFSASRWFTRGWTLQELIAPDIVHFYNRDWLPVGTKEELLELVATATGIDMCALDGYKPLTDFTVARRMFWASRRQTTRPEDMAYCLLGIFGINMPLLYGERENAFLRLQEEIMKTTSDQSLFAWTMSFWTPYDGPLAKSPAYFQRSSALAQFQTLQSGLPLPKSAEGGVRVNVLLWEDLQSDYAVAVLHCEVGTIPGVLAGIRLRRLGKNFDELEFCRWRNSKLLMFANSSSSSAIILKGYNPSEEQSRLIFVNSDEPSE
jgi:hypothetical protein